MFELPPKRDLQAPPTAPRLMGSTARPDRSSPAFATDCSEAYRAPFGFMHVLGLSAVPCPCAPRDQRPPCFHWPQCTQCSPCSPPVLSGPPQCAQCSARHAPGRRAHVSGQERSGSGSRSDLLHNVMHSGYGSRGKLSHSTACASRTTRRPAYAQHVLARVTAPCPPSHCCRLCDHVLLPKHVLE